MGAISISAYIVVVTMAHILGGSRRSRIWTAVVLGLWFIGVCAIGASQVLVGGGALRTGGLGALVIVPVVVLSAVTFLSKDLREWIRQIPMLPLIAVQILRTLGIIFVLLYEVHRLPAPFAPFAGYGDISASISVRQGSLLTPVGRTLIDPLRGLLEWSLEYRDEMLAARHAYAKGAAER